MKLEKEKVKVKVNRKRKRESEEKNENNVLMACFFSHPVNHSNIHLFLKR